MKKLFKSINDWFAKPIEGVSGAIRLCLFIFIALPVMGFLVYLAFMVPLGIISHIFGIDPNNNHYEGVCGDGGRYDPDC